MDPLNAQLQFLKQAANQLAISAPVVSASLGSTHNRLSIHTEEDPKQANKNRDALRRDVCGACGTLMIPGCSCTVSYQSSSTRAKTSPVHTRKTAAKQVVYTCLRCDRKTVLSLQPRAPKHVTSKGRHLRGLRSEAFDPLPEQGEGEKEGSKSANATSKQRKKARKGGLQAMLEKNKTQSSSQSGLGLDLMDFMQ